MIEAPSRAAARSQPKISVITVLRTDAESLARCLDSLKAQNYPNLEVILVETAEDKALEPVLAQYKAQITHHVHIPGANIFAAIEAGFKQATGDLIGILHAEDWLAPGAAETLAALYKAEPDADMFAFHMRYSSEDSRDSRETGDMHSPHFLTMDGLYCQLLNRFYSHALIRREGRFDAARYPQLADREFLMRVGLGHAHRAVTSETLYYCRSHAALRVGGKPGRTAALLEEAIAIAENILRERQIAGDDRKYIREWSVSNRLRACIYQLLTLRWGSALQSAVKLTMQPRTTLQVLANLRLRRFYRRTRTA